jgi:general stress protein YciG
MQNNERGGSGNFANDPEKASEAGKRGGEHSHSGQKEAGQSHRGGSSNFAEDGEKASEAGRKGGEHRHGGGRS